MNKILPVRRTKPRGRTDLPKPSQLSDGRWRIRYKVNCKTYESYCPKDASADERNEWVVKTHSKVVKCRKEPFVASAPATVTFSMSGEGPPLLSDAVEAFIREQVTPRSRERIMRRRSRGGHGYVHRDDYAAKRLVQMLGSLGDRHVKLHLAGLKPKMGIELIDFMEAQEWSSNKCVETVRMMCELGIWCSTTYEVDNKFAGIATVIRKAARYRMINRVKTSRSAALENLPSMECVLKRLSDANQPLLLLAVTAQYFLSARPSEVLSVRRSMLIDDGSRLCFEVPHKNDFRPNASPRRLVFGVELSETLRVLMDISGDDAIFSPLMFELVDRFKVPLDQPDALKRRYERYVREAKESEGVAARGLARKLQPIPAGQFRKRLKKHAQIVPYDVRHMSISEIALTNEGLAPTAAGHKDPKATSRYIHRGLKDHKALATETESILRKSLGGAWVA